MPYREPTKKDRIKSYSVIFVAVLIFISCGFFILPQFGIYLYLVVIFITLFMLVFWHARTSAYRCTECGNEFEISFIKDLITPHVPHKKYLKCPRCGYRDWMMELSKI